MWLIGLDAYRPLQNSAKFMLIRRALLTVKPPIYALKRGILRPSLAAYGTTPGAPRVLTVKKGNVVFVVHVTGLPDDQTKAKEKTSRSKSSPGCD
jgi:hypothetical protein